MIAPPYWITNQLAIILCPWGDNFLDNEMLAHRAAGIDIVVSMLQKNEARDLGLAEEEISAKRAGMLCGFTARMRTPLMPTTVALSAMAPTPVTC